MARPRCLIIDASMMVRRVASRIIRSFGYDVIEASNGGDALALCAAPPPDVILLDWNLDDMDAGQFLARLKTNLSGHKRPKVLFCTADRRLERIQSALSLRADEYVMKPFDSDIIESKFRLSGLPVVHDAPTAKAS